MRKDSRRQSGDPNRRHHLWMIALTAVVASLLVHNALNGGPAKARGRVMPSAFTQSPS
jgi:hypothetical protein